MSLFLLLLACVEPQRPRAAVLPEEGPWRYAEEGLVSTTCGERQTQPYAALAIRDATDERFTLQADDEVYACGLAGEQFACASAESLRLDLGPFDIEMALETSGQLLAPNRLRGVHTLTVRCIGQRCEGVSPDATITLPCAWVFAFSAER